jgi:hypothetical protein
LTVQLAEPCDKKEKAFENSTYGKVLGVFFDTITLSWCLPKEKRLLALECIRKSLSAENIELRDFQVLMGRLNNVCQMAVFMKGFKGPLNKMLSVLQKENSNPTKLSSQAKADLRVWARFLADKNVWWPLCPKHVNPPLASRVFVSDAAGFSDNQHLNGKLGCGSIGLDIDGSICFATQIFWNDNVIQSFRDEDKKRLGNKTMCLEFLGILLPFVMCPELVSGRYVTVKVDNIGCYFAWINRYSSEDQLTSILVRALHILSAYLACEVHIEHLPRVSSWEAILVDRLSTVEKRQLHKLTEN